MENKDLKNLIAFDQALNNLVTNYINKKNCNVFQVEKVLNDSLSKTHLLLYSAYNNKIEELEKEIATLKEKKDEVRV